MSQFKLYRRNGILPIIEGGGEGHFLPLVQSVSFSVSIPISYREGLGRQDFQAREMLTAPVAQISIDAFGRKEFIENRIFSNYFSEKPRPLFANINASMGLYFLIDTEHGDVINVIDYNVQKPFEGKIMSGRDAVLTNYSFSVGARALASYTAEFQAYDIKTIEQSGDTIEEIKDISLDYKIEDAVRTDGEEDNRTKAFRNQTGIIYTNKDESVLVVNGEVVSTIEMREDEPDLRPSPAVFYEIRLIITNDEENKNYNKAVTSVTFEAQIARREKFGFGKETGTGMEPMERKAAFPIVCRIGISTNEHGLEDVDYNLIDDIKDRAVDFELFFLDKQTGETFSLIAKGALLDSVGHPSDINTFMTTNYTFVVEATQNGGVWCKKGFNR